MLPQVPVALEDKLIQLNCYDSCFNAYAGNLNKHYSCVVNYCKSLYIEDLQNISTENKSLKDQSDDNLKNSCQDCINSYKNNLENQESINCVSFLCKAQILKLINSNSAKQSDFTLKNSDFQEDSSNKSNVKLNPLWNSKEINQENCFNYLNEPVYGFPYDRCYSFYSKQGKTKFLSEDNETEQEKALFINVFISLACVLMIFVGVLIYNSFKKSQEYKIDYNESQIPYKTII